MDEVTLLNYEQTFGDNKLNILKKISRRASITDFAILLGGAAGNEMVAYKSGSRSRNY